MCIWVKILECSHGMGDSINIDVDGRRNEGKRKASNK